MQKSILTMLMILLAVAATVNANTVWNPAANPDQTLLEYKWNDAANWTNGVPDSVDELGAALNDGKTVFNVPGAADCIVDTADAICKHIVSGDNNLGGVLRIVDGGFLTTRTTWSTAGYNNPGTWIVEEGGEIYIGGHLWVSMNDGADGTIIINGGTIKVKDAIDFGRNTGSVATVTINSGLLQARYLPDDSSTEGSIVNIRYGTLAFENNYTASDSRLYKRINAGSIVGFGVVGALNVERVNGLTLVTANDPMDPFPAMNETVYIDDKLGLSWINMDPNTPGVDPAVDVWFGVLEEGETEPNKLGLVYTKVVEAGVNVTGVEVNALAKGTYFWQIELVGSLADEPNSLVYTFNTTDDLTPTVTIETKNTLSFAGEEGMIQLEATVSDTGDSAVHIEWSHNAANEPNVIFSDASIEDPTVASDSHQPNTTITVTVWDDFNGIENASSATVLVDFADNKCQGARGGFMHLGQVYIADLNEDCIINLADFAIIAEQWIDGPLDSDSSYALEGPIEIVANP